MAGTQFSPDRVKAGPGRHVGAGPGPMQRRADRQQRQQARQARPKSNPAGPQQGVAGGQQPSSSSRSTPQLGYPQGTSEAETEQPAGDYRHVQLLAQHQNMRGLGREAAFGIQAILTGEYRQMLNDPDKVPFDILEDGP